MWVFREKISQMCEIEQHRQTELKRLKKQIPIENGIKEINILKHIQGIVGVPILLSYKIENEKMVFSTAFFKGRSIQAVDLTYGEFLMAFVRGLKILNRIHQRDILHRDLCPRHILMDEDQNVQIIDFGVATEREVVEDILGTLSYAAPEALFDVKNYGTYSDLYAYTKVFYEIYMQQYIKKHPQLLAVFNKGMALDRTMRYQNCEEMLSDMFKMGFML